MRFYTRLFCVILNNNNILYVPTNFSTLQKKIPLAEAYLTEVPILTEVFDGGPYHIETSLLICRANQ